MKKLVSLILVCLLLATSFSMVVSAETDKVVMGEIRVKKLHGASATNHRQNAQEVLSKYVDLPTFSNLILDGIANCKAKVDVSKYNIPTSALDAITNYFFYGVPMAFSVSKMGCSYTSNIVTINIYYNSFADTADEYSACVAKINSATDKLLSGIKGNNALNDEEKLLLIHDRLVLWNTYGYPENTTSIEAHTAYGALGNKMSVCQGYAMAYMHLLDEVDIKSYYCSSESLVHGWNIVFLNGEKYHVDVTWDDAYVDEKMISHDNFLRSSDGIYSTGHKATDYDTSPTDTKYDNYFWQDHLAEFQLAGDEIYYVDNAANVIKRYSDKKAICSVEAVWLAGENSYWPGNYSCIASDGKSLFYSGPKSVYRLDLTTNKSEVIYTPQLDTYESIFGLSYQDEVLICDISDTPNEIKRKVSQNYKYDYDNNNDTDQSGLGDVNGDSKINNKDLAILIQHINGWKVGIDLNFADVNGDKKINNKDYAILMQYINGWPVKLG